MIINSPKIVHNLNRSVDESPMDIKRDNSRAVVSNNSKSLMLQGFDAKVNTTAEISGGNVRASSLQDVTVDLKV